MKKFSEQFHKKATSISLRANEKRELENRLRAYMAYHPLPGMTAAVSVSKISWYSRFFSSKTAMAFSVFLLLAGIPAVAERSMPGDVLYPVKVKVNEEVLGTLARSPYEKVEWETKRLERRIAEARALAENGRLTPEIEAGVAIAALNHTRNAAEGLAELRVTDAKAAASAEMSLMSTVEAQSSILLASRGGQDSDVEETAVPMVALARALDDGRDALSLSGSATTIDIDTVLGQVETETKKGRETITALKDKVSTYEFNTVERRLADIERSTNASIQSYERLRTKSEDGAVDEEMLAEVRSSLRNTLNDAKKLNIFVGNLGVRNSVSLDNILPIVPTEDEKRIIASEQFAMAERNLTIVKGRLSRVTDKTLLEEVELEIEQINLLLEDGAAGNIKDIDVANEKLSALMRKTNEFSISLKTSTSTNVTNNSGETNSGSSTDRE